MEDAGPDHEVQLQPERVTSQWIINWNGVIPVLLLVIVAIVLWRWLDGAGSSTGEVSSGTAVTTVREEPITTTTRPSTTTTRPTTTIAQSTTTTVAVEPQVNIRGEMGPCSFGENCLIAGFSIDGFDEHPGRFTCIYPNSERERSFSNDDVDVACVTADDGDTITIEVDGVRSATISETDLDGAG